MINASVGINYSREIGLLTNSAKAIRNIGGATVILGAALDIYGVFNYRRFGADDPLAVHPVKAGLNLGIGVYSFYSNPFVAPIYFGVDAFYPGGWPAAIEDQGRQIERNQKILGPQSCFPR